ncbi:MAG: RING-HC finger protein [Chlamydiia bacterium]|nr:RING-HC finger protein [Chlamydiia bacterium]
MDATQPINYLPAASLALSAFFLPKRLTGALALTILSAELIDHNNPQNRNYSYVPYALLGALALYAGTKQELVTVALMSAVHATRYYSSQNANPTTPPKGSGGAPPTPVAYGNQGSTQQVTAQVGTAGGGRKIDTIFHTEGVLISADKNNGLFNAAWLPWGFGEVNATRLPNARNGVIFSTGNTFSDQSCEGIFKCKEINSIEQQFGIQFNFHMSKESKLTVDTETKKSLGIPANATDFQCIYPAIQNITKDGTKFEATEEINQAINTLDPQMQNFIRIGGYFYHDGPWRTENGERLRSIAGYRALDPNSMNEKKICFGQAKAVTQTMQTELGKLSREKNYPALFPITVGPLHEHGLSHFKWLPPEDPMIKQMQTKEEPQFGALGAFVYYSSTDPNKSCMVPIVTQEESMKTLRHHFFLKVECPDVDKARQVVFTADECVVCLTNKPEIKTNCNHLVMCNTCASEVSDCPTCRAPITTRETVDSGNVMPLKDWTEFPMTLPFQCQNVALYQGWINMIRRDPRFLSEAIAIPQQLQAAFKLPKGYTTMRFIYPVSGKGLDLTYPLIPEIQSADLTPAQRALAEIGGFVFENNQGGALVYSIVPPGTEGESVTVTYAKKEAIPGDQALIKAQLANLNDMKQQRYDICRITYGFFLPFAKYFSFINGKFVYISHTGDKCYTLELQA